MSQLIAAQNNFIADYLYRFSNDECHPDFHFWAGLALLGHVVGTRVWINHGRFPFHPCLLVIEVGTAGSGKSTAKNEAKGLFVDLFPLQLVSDHIQSREFIIGEMFDSPQFWKHPDDPKLKEYHPIFLLVNELADWISVNPAKMLGFLIDTFGESVYGVGFKKDKEAGLPKQTFPWPIVSMIACAQPEWFLNNIKTDMFTRGLGRRCIILKREPVKLNDDPHVPDDSHDGWSRVKKHLKRLGSPTFYGELRKTSEASEWYKKWHNDPKRKHRYDDPMLNSQLLDTQHVLLYKVASLYSLARYDFNFEVTVNDFILALQQLHALEKDIAALMATTGKNEMTPVSALMVQAVDANGGWMNKSQLLLAFNRHSKDMRAYNDGVNFLLMTEQLAEAQLEIPGMQGVRWIYYTKAGRVKLEEKGVRFQK